MALVFQEALAAIFRGKVTTNRGWLSQVKTNGRLKDPNAQEGEVKISFIKMTASTPSAGTLNPQGLTMTAVSGTLTSTQSTAIFSYHEAKAQITQPGGLRELIEEGSDSCLLAVQEALAADVVAKVAVPITENTLPTGQIDFFSDGTVAESKLALSAMQLTVSQFQSKFMQYTPPGDYHIVMTATGHGNLTTVKQTGIQFITMGDDGINRFKNIPIFILPDDTTGFGLTENAAAWVFQKDSLLLAFKAPFLSNGGAFDAGDSQVRWTINVPFAHAVVGPSETTKFHFGQVLNPTA